MSSDPTDSDAPPPDLHMTFDDLPPLLEMSTEAIHITDHKGRVVFATHSFAEILGYSIEEILGGHISLWEAQWSGTELEATIEEILALPPGHYRLVETIYKKKDGTVFPVELHSSAFTKNGIRFAFHSSRDITRKKEAELSIKVLTDYTLFLARANRSVFQAEDEDSLYVSLCRLAVSLDGLALAWIGVPGEDGFFRILASSGETGWLDEVKVPSDPKKSGIASAPYQAWQSGRPVFNLSFDEIPEGESSPFGQNIQKALRQFGFKSLAALPVILDEKVAFVISLYHLRPFAFDHPLQEILTELSRDLSLGIERLQSLRSKRESLAIRNALLDNSLSGILLIKNRIIMKVNARILEMLGYERADELEGQPVQILYCDDQEFQRVGNLIYPRVFQERRVLITDIRTRKKTGELLWTDASTILTRIGEEDCLVVTIHDTTERHLHARALERLAAVNALHAQANAILTMVEDEGLLLKELCDLAINQAGVSLAWIGQPGSNNCINFLAASGKTDFLREALISVDSTLANGQGPTGMAWRESRAVFDELFSEGYDGAPWKERALRYGLKSLAVLPIRHKGVLWGLFALYYGERQAFDASIRTVLEELAEGVSRGLDRLDSRTAEKRTSALNAAILKAAALGVVLSEGPVVRFANSRMEEFLSTAPPFEGRDLFEILGRPEEPTGLPKHLLRPAGEKEHVVVEVPVFLSGSTEPRWLELSGVPFEQVGYDTLWTVSDITPRKKAREGEILLARALVAVNEGVIITDDRGHIIYTNEAFTTITEYSRYEVEGRDCRFLQGSGTNRQTVSDIRRALDTGTPYRGQILNYKKDGTPFWNLLTLSPVRNQEGAITHFVGVQNDITAFQDLLEQNTRLAFSAQHDPLTGLPNRSSLDDYLLKLVARKTRQGGRFLVGILDLDDFKPVNDTFGHAAGDTLLREIAERLTSTIRSHDLICRLGGDEFVLIVDEIDTSEREEFLALLDRLHQTIETAFEILPGQHTHIGLSMGIAFYPSDALDPETLLSEADRALCHIKEKKESRSQWWQVAGSVGQETTSNEVAPYGETARRLLEKYADSIDPAVEHFVTAFYRQLDFMPETQRIMELLGEEGRRTLALRQQEHLRFLLSPQTEREAILSRAFTVGQIHCLSGVSNSLLVAGMTLYRRLLSTQIHRGLVPDRDRTVILTIADHRIEDHVKTELETEIATIGRYMDAAMADPPVATELQVSETLSLGNLPGILGAFFLFREKPSTPVRAEALSGPRAKILCPLLENSLLGILDQKTPEIRAYPLKGTSLEENFEEIVHAGARSLLAIPLQTGAGGSFGSSVHHWVVLAGAHTNQFDSAWAQQFAQSLRQRIEKRLQGDIRESGGIPPETRAAYRKDLREGGLSMYMQPVVDLKTKALTKVEALARLLRPGGEIVLPSRFLPALSAPDLDWLFRNGLAQSLSHLAKWDRSGLSVDVSVNIAPSTLVNPMCGEWVSEALASHSISPERLTLEILENQSLAESKEHRTAIARLLSLGIKLSMDDMGVGYSNLQRLASLPFDKIKIDQSLLAHIRINPLETLGIIGAIVQMGRELSHGIVVEGLEDDGMIETAIILNIQYGQGFSLARPMPAEQIIPWNHERDMGKHPDSLTSWLGALASAWTHIHANLSSPLPLHKCPLTEFLSRNADDEGRASRWHETLHGNEDALDEGKELSKWLALKVREEGAAMERVRGESSSFQCY